MIFRFTHNHLKQIAETPHLLGHLCGKTKLEPLHSQWIKYIWDTYESRSLQAHRGSYKTTAVVEIGAIRWLLFHPNDRIAIVKKTYTMAVDSARTVRDLMKLEPIQALFKFAHGFYPKLTQRKEDNLIWNFKKDITREGNLGAFGLGGAYTGTHWDKILLDDAITMKDRISRAERDTTKDQIREIQTNVIDPGKPCGFTGTPWHRDDGWTIIPKPIIYPVSDTGLLSSAEQERLKSLTTKSLWDCNYNLEHTSGDDAVFKDPKFEAWKFNMKGVEVVGHLDAAFEGDCTNGLTFMAQFPDGTIQAIGWMFTESVKEKIQFVANKMKMYSVKRMHIETNADKGYTADLLREAMPTIQILDYHEDMNKDIKIVSYLKHYWHNIVWAPDTDDEYMNQILDWREGEKPDDCPDSAASCLRKGFYENNNTDMALYQL